MTRFIFVRHGQAVAAENRCIGHTDVPLSPGGAAALRELVSDEPSGSRNASLRLVSSDLRRAAESAAVIATATGCTVQLDPRLREMHFGAWDGLAWSKIERDDRARFRTWMETWIAVAPPGGESAAALAQRAAQWTSDTLATAGTDECIIVVSHAGWIRAALTHLLARDLAGMFQISVEYARATIVDVSPAGAVVVATNAARLGGSLRQQAPERQ